MGYVSVPCRVLVVLLREGWEKQWWLQWSNEQMKILGPRVTFWKDLVSIPIHCIEFRIWMSLLRGVNLWVRLWNFGVQLGCGLGCQNHLSWRPFQVWCFRVRSILVVTRNPHPCEGQLTSTGAGFFSHQQYDSLSKMFEKLHYYPQYPCMVYFPTFGWFVW